MKLYNLLNVEKAKLYIDYLLSQGFQFNVVCWTSHVGIEVPDKADAPLTEWQGTILSDMTPRAAAPTAAEPRLREVFGDECAVDECPYERHEGSTYCAEHIKAFAS